MRKKLNVALSSKRSHERGDLMPYVSKLLYLKEHRMCKNKKMRTTITTVFFFLLFIISKKHLSHTNIWVVERLPNTRKQK